MIRRCGCERWRTSDGSIIQNVTSGSGSLSSFSHRCKFFAILVKERLQFHPFAKKIQVKKVLKSKRTILITFDFSRPAAG